MEANLPSTTNTLCTSYECFTAHSGYKLSLSNETVSGCTRKRFLKSKQVFSHSL